MTLRIELDPSRRSTRPRAVPRPRPRCRPAVEGLEPRRLLASADLSLAITGPPVFTTSGTVTFSAVVTNLGPDPATSVDLTETLTIPTGATVTFKGASQGSVATDSTPGLTTFDAMLGTIAPQSSATLLVAVALTQNATFTDTAEVKSATTDTDMTNNSASSTFQVAGEAAVALTPSAASTTPGRPVTLTALVSTPTGFAPPTGTVTFLDGVTKLGMMTLGSSGPVSLVVPALGLGTHSITAQYSGDSHYPDVASPVTTVHVGTPGDFDGDGKADIAIYDQTAATFYVVKSGGGTIAQAFGNPKDVNIPVAGDFDGDGKTDLAIYDQTIAEFFVVKSGGGTIAQAFGSPKDVNVPVAGDFDGDGKTDIAIYDQSEAVLYAVKSGGGTIAQSFGNPALANVFVPYDFDGDGKTDIAIYDQSDAEFFVVDSGGGTLIQPFGNKAHKNKPA